MKLAISSLLKEAEIARLILHRLDKDAFATTTKALAKAIRETRFHYKRMYGHYRGPERRRKARSSFYH